jgi:hypothetical protein
LGGGGDVDEKLAAVVRVTLASNQGPLLEVVEQRRDRARGTDESLSYYRGLEWLASALDDREDLARAL